MFRLRNNSRYDRPVDVGPSPERLRSLLVLNGSKLFAPKGDLRRTARLYVPSFTGATYLSAPNPENLDCQCTPDEMPQRSGYLRPTRSIPHYGAQVAHLRESYAAARQAPFYLCPKGYPMFENTGVQGAHTT